MEVRLILMTHSSWGPRPEVVAELSRVPAVGEAVDVRGVRGIADAVLWTSDLPRVTVAPYAEDGRRWPVGYTGRRS